MPLWESGVSVACSDAGAGLFAFGAFAGLFGAGLFAWLLVEHEMRKH